MSERLTLDRWAVWTLLRAALGLAAIGLCLVDGTLPHGAQVGAAVLVLAVWYDAVLGWLARRSGWVKSLTVTQLEGFVDFVCFAWAPAQLAWSLVADWRLLPVLGLFVLGCIYRLARFNVEGLHQGGYRGLPVTYNGYWFPLAAGVCWLWLTLPPLYVFFALIVVVTPLMVTGRFTTPEV